MKRHPESYYEYRFKYSIAISEYQKKLNKWIKMWNKIMKAIKDKEQT